MTLSGRILRYFLEVLAIGSVLLIYTAVLLPLDYAMDFDYGYLGQNSDVVDMLGEWPARVILLLLLETCAFIVLWLPFALTAKASALTVDQPVDEVPPAEDGIRALD